VAGSYQQLRSSPSPYPGLQSGARPPEESEGESGLGSASPAVPLTPVPPPPGLDDWKDLLSLRPPEEVQRALADEHTPDWWVQRIEEAHGPINLDYYPIEVDTLPSRNGQTLTATEVLRHIRLQLNTIVGQETAQFFAYDAKNATKWLSADPLGAVVHIDMLSGNPYFNFDDGSVVCSESTPSSWVFTTVWTTGDWGHPVSGNRRWGYTASGGTLTFFTRGADRPHAPFDAAVQSIIFSSAHALWSNFQKGVARFVNDNGGAATIGEPVSRRYDWAEVEKQYFAPTVPWVDEQTPFEFGGGDMGGAGAGGGW
jgi:hypothetical protein